MIAQLQSTIANRQPVMRPSDELTAADRERLKIERYVLLRRSAAIAIIISAVLAIVALALCWSKGPPPLLVAWAAAVVALAGVRLVFLRLSAASTPQALIRFGRVHMVAIAANGVLWGGLAPIYAALGQIGSPFLPIVLAGLTAAATASAVASWRAVLAFNAPALGILAATYAVALPATEGPAIAGVVALYGVATGWLAYRTQNNLTRLMRTRMRHQNLLKALNRQADIAHEADARFRAIVEGSKDITLIFSPDGKATYASPSVEVMLGAAPQELIGASTRCMVHPDDFPFFKLAGERALASLGEVIPINHICLRAPGGRYVALSGRLTNMLYVPGVEGFVFNAGPLQHGAFMARHAAE